MGKTSFCLVVLAGLTAQDKIVELGGLAKILNNFYGQKSYIGKMDRPAKFGYPTKMGSGKDEIK